MNASPLERLLLDFQLTDECAKLNDEQLADAIMRELWAKTLLGTRESALLTAVIERLRRRTEPPLAKN